MANENFNKAKLAKSDEFYTQLVDIENELKNYKEHLVGKVVFCNCDDPEKSNFWKYCYMNFDIIGIKRLISTHYKPSTILDRSEQAYKLEYDGKEIKRTNLNGDGDFRSEECVGILKQADVVCTNPPFSLFREFVAQLMQYEKKFLIIGNMNAITYKEVFLLIKNNKMWYGQSISSGDREFRVPDHYPLHSAGFRVDNDGAKYIRVKGVRWFTNLDNKKRHEDLTLGKKYNPKDYPKYDNYGAINVDKTSDIPVDYDGAMGVPVTFLDKYNPDQFEIVALGSIGSIEFTKNKQMEILDKAGKPTGKFTYNAKGGVYRLYNPKTDKLPNYKDVKTGDLFVKPYARIIIKKK